MRDKLDQLLRWRRDSGVIYEPRVYFDHVDLLDSPSGFLGPPTHGNPEAFRNGEQFPVTLTHAAFALDTYDQVGVVTRENEIQRVGVRLRYNDNYYMNTQHFPAPLWSNKPVGLSDLCFGTSIWRFNDGVHVEENGGGSFVLSDGDTLLVDVEYQGAANLAYTVRVTVSFTGIGLFSQRPYFLSSSTDFASTTAAVTTLIPDDYRNDGAEPILITDMNVHTTGEDDREFEDATAGEIRRVWLNVRQTGNSTHAHWFQGPSTPTIVMRRMPAVLLGVTGGRAVIHEFPDPVVLEPGDDITLEAKGFRAATSGSLPDTTLNAALLGYMVVR